MSFSYARSEISSFEERGWRPYVDLMKNRELKFKTKFWRDVAARLPAEVRERHAADLQRAERFELGLDGAIEAFARVKAAFVRTFHTPRGAH
jgi:hypothetical protein